MPAAERTALLIAGMRGNACRETLADALQAVDGVKAVHVNLYRARATIVHGPRCAPADLVAAAARAGFGAAPDSGAPAGPGRGPCRTVTGEEARR